MCIGNVLNVLNLEDAHFPERILQCKLYKLVRTTPSACYLEHCWNIKTKIYMYQKNREELVNQHVLFIRQTHAHKNTSLVLRLFNKHLLPYWQLSQRTTTLVSEADAMMSRMQQVCVHVRAYFSHPTVRWGSCDIFSAGLDDMCHILIAPSFIFFLFSGSNVLLGVKVCVGLT